MGRTLRGGVGRVRAAALGAAVGILMGAGGAGAAPWDARDVAAAESYRDAERERADRYRARAAQQEARVGKSVREPASTGESPTDRVETVAERGAVALWSWLAEAFLAEFDLAAIESAIASLRSGWAWWEEEASPRVRRIWEVLGSLEGGAAGS
jgi:hypothetical protein